MNKLTAWDAPMDEAFEMPAQVVLEKINVACQVAENPMALNGLTYERRVDDIVNRVIHSFRAHVYGRKVEEREYAEPLKTRRDVVEYVPVSWWDHLKATIVEKWPWTRLKWKKRDVIATVREETIIHKTVYHTCPHWNLETPGRHLTFLQYDGSNGYPIAGLEDKARALVDAYMQNRPFDAKPQIERAVHELRRILEQDKH